MSVLHLELIIAVLSILLALALLRCILPILRARSMRPIPDVDSAELLSTPQFTNKVRLQTILAQTPVVLSAINPQGVFVFSEGRALQALPEERKKRIGRSVFDIYRDYPAILSDIRRALAGEALTIQHDIGDYTVETQLTPVYNEKKQFIGVICVGIDITERVRVERALRHQACYDPITDLPNAKLLYERIAQALQTEEHKELAVILLDLDRFRDVNDTFGHQGGNIILKEVGRRLANAFAAPATVSRLGNNVFVIFLPEIDEKKAHEAISTTCCVFEQPFFIQDFPLHIEASIGIALSYTHGTDFSTLMREADVAMYIAKCQHSTYVFYKPELNPYTPRRFALLGSLRAAITDGEMILYYQPQIDLQTGITHSVEGLIRWNHPEYGFIPPDQFIPLAEQTGLIQPLTLWVLETAIKQCADWLQQGIHLSVSVNLSARNLRETHLPETLASLLERYTLPARYLCVEVTESAVMIDVEQAVETLKRISAQGIKIAVDDFGTGYSSLAYLKRLPVNELKIDRSFVKEMITDRGDATIVQSTVTMAHGLGLKVVAEGIEDLETAHQLATFDCDCGQGYFWSRPVPAHELVQWLEKTKSVVIV